MRGRELREGFKRRGGLARSRFKTSKRGKGRKREVRELDMLFRQLIIARDHRCVMAGISGGCGGPVQVSHVRPKGKFPALRWEPDNAFLACQRHHMYVWHRDVLVSAAWFARTYPERAARLEQLCQSPGKVNLERARHRLTIPDP